MSFTQHEAPAGTEAKNEGDTNADTCCLGSNFIALEITNRTAEVYPYDPSYEPIANVPIVTGATAYDDEDGTTFILIFHESLFYGKKLRHSLINPNQVRHHGLDFWDNPFDHRQELSIVLQDGIYIPLKYEGTRLFFKSRVPTREELSSCQHIEMTSSLPWEPSEVKLGKVSQSTSRNVFSVKIDTRFVSTSPSDYFQESVRQYSDPSTDEAILSEINSVLVTFNEDYKRYLNSTTSHPYAFGEDIPSRKTFVSNQRHGKISSDLLSELWHIGPKRAKATLEATTQNGIRSAILPLSRRYRSDRMYNVKRLRGRFATDTVYADIKSLLGNTCAQIYTHKIGFAVSYPLPVAKGEEVGQTLLNFIHDFGAPEHLTFDGAQVQVGKNTLFQKVLRKNVIDYHVSSPRRPNENPAEGSIREIRRRWYMTMTRKKVPKRLWDYLIIWICETGNLSVSSSKYAHGRTALEVITGETPDISEYLDFGFYDWVIYRSNAGMGEPSLGRWIGVSHKVGQSMSYWIITVSGSIISCVTVQRLTEDEKQTDEYRKRMSEFDERLETRLDVLGSDHARMPKNDSPDWNRLSLDENDKSFDEDFHKIINDESIPESDEESYSDKRDEKVLESFSSGHFDPYLHMEVGLPRGSDDQLHHAMVKRRAIDSEGRPIGIGSSNPLTDTRVYEVEFLDGTKESLSANIIAENLLAQVDEEGHRQLLMDEIIDHRKNTDAIEKKDGVYITRQGTKRHKMTTRGWELCVQWKDGSSNWVALKDLKHAYPVELAQYSIANNLEDEPAFAWWVPHTLKKRERILKKIKSKYWQRSHKYGIRIPKSVQEALKIDEETNTTYWRDAIEDEMRKIKEMDVFKVYDGKPEDLFGYKCISTHMIFDIKLGENLRRKARLVADGHKTDPPSSVTYSSVVSRVSVRICLLIAALNELDLQAADVENAYLLAKCREKVCIVAGPEFGDMKGKTLIINRALYGLKSSGASFRSFLAERLDDMGFKPSIADPDVWMRPAVKSDGEKYYEYILCYVDDILVLSVDAEKPLKEIAAVLPLKKNKIAPPEFYLGAKLEKKNLNGKEMWTMNSTDYLKAALDNVLNQMEKRGVKIPSRVSTPMAAGYLPELDLSPELNADDVTHFQELIGILRWAVEIGRVDILTELSMLSSYQASPRRGHLEQVYHIFAYIKKKIKLTLYFDPSPPNIDMTTFKGDRANVFKEQYRGAEEEFPPRMPKPRGRQVTTTAFVDSSHASNKITRKSHTGYVIFVNRAPIVWYSKRQNTIESSAFSSEFVAAKTCVEHIAAIRYKLRMFGVPLDGPTNVLCDNESVVKNSSRIDSTLHRKHVSIAYHAVRWAVAAEMIRVGWIPSKENIADALTKVLTGPNRDALFGSWTY